MHPLFQPNTVAIRRSAMLISVLMLMFSMFIACPAAADEICPAELRFVHPVELHLSAWPSPAYHMLSAVVAAHTATTLSLHLLSIESNRYYLSGFQNVIFSSSAVQHDYYGYQSEPLYLIFPGNASPQAVLIQDVQGQGLQLSADTCLSQTSTPVIPYSVSSSATHIAANHFGRAIPIAPHILPTQRPVVLPTPSSFSLRQHGVCPADQEPGLIDPAARVSQTFLHKVPPTIRVWLDGYGQIVDTHLLQSSGSIQDDALAFQMVYAASYRPRISQCYAIPSVYDFIPIIQNKTPSPH